MDFCTRLKQLRKEKEYTQGQLADFLHYGYTAISNYESGRNEPSIKDIIRLADVFSVTVDYLLGHSPLRSYPQKPLPPLLQQLSILYPTLTEQEKVTLQNLILLFQKK